MGGGQGWGDPAGTQEARLVPGMDRWADSRGLGGRRERADVGDLEGPLPSQRLHSSSRPHPVGRSRAQGWGAAHRVPSTAQTADGNGPRGHTAHRSLRARPARPGGASQSSPPPTVPGGHPGGCCRADSLGWGPPSWGWRVRFWIFCFPFRRAAAADAALTWSPGLSLVLSRPPSSLHGWRGAPLPLPLPPPGLAGPAWAPWQPSAPQNPRRSLQREGPARLPHPRPVPAQQLPWSPQDGC